MMGYGYSHNSEGGNPHEEVRADVSKAADSLERKTERRVANRRKTGGTKGGDMAGAPLVNKSKVQTFA